MTTQPGRPTIDYPTINQLEAFLAVRATGSYSKAAQTLGQNPSLMWRTISRLEQKLGLKLFEKGGGRRGLSPTPHAEALAEQAVEVIEAARNLLAVAEDVDGRSVRRFTVACSSTHVRVGVAEAIATFRQERPEIDVRLLQFPDQTEARSADDLFLALTRKIADLIVAPFRDVDPSRVARFRFYGWWIAALAPPEGEARHQPLRARDLADKPLLVPPPGHEVRELIEWECRGAGFEPRIAFESPSWEAILALHRHGHGTAIVASDALPPEALRNAERVVGRSGNVIGGVNSVYMRTDSSPGNRDDFLLAFVSHLQAAIRDSRPATPGLGSTRTRS